MILAKSFRKHNNVYDFHSQQKLAPVHIQDRSPLENDRVV